MARTSKLLCEKPSLLKYVICRIGGDVEVPWGPEVTDGRKFLWDRERKPNHSSAKTPCLIQVGGPGAA